ncbi:hypothetical protein IZ6_25410 [Terrihabitans soli]|uniref:Uncharacterized protein n=1 Tax=Terrihabitans soli TaxID=708113 RepID=A0A6S6QQI2_9HYPH|nr:hypothetical protein [Terrihabitans soli]BCJ91806.1 hypothetical protein IZ6_25410 [Terrihabitans soli]
MRDIFINARKWLADPKHWVQGELCVYDDVNNPDLRKVSCTCLMGALDRASSIKANDALIWADYDVLAFLRKFIPNTGDGNDIAGFNDDTNTTHADVLAVLDRAIAACPLTEVENPVAHH